MEYSITQRLPDNGQRVLAYGYRTFCCTCDKDEERDWHEVVFSFHVCSYSLKNEIPDDLEESILKTYTICEQWDLENEEPFDHLIGVTMWMDLKKDA